MDASDEHIQDFAYLNQVYREICADYPSLSPVVGMDDTETQDITQLCLRFEIDDADVDKYNSLERLLEINREVKTLCTL